MKCPFCHQKSETLLYLRFYTRQGIKVCGNCRSEIERNKGKPYSKVMERLALLETGYRINRKLARL